MDWQSFYIGVFIGCMLGGALIALLCASKDGG